MSNSLRPHGLQHTRLPCPSPTPRACSDSCLSNWWCRPTISSPIVPFSSWLQSFPASGSFPRSCSLHQVAKVLELQLQPQSSNGYSGVTFFRIDWFHLSAVQGTQESSLTPQFWNTCIPVADSFWYLAKLKNTGVHNHFLLQEIFPTPGSNLSLLHGRQILYHLRHQRSLL